MNQVSTINLQASEPLLELRRPAELILRDLPAPGLFFLLLA
ncbi:MAG TPA: hypothetical protein VMS11_07070 [Solirubrobacterales bacterium]|nr:hypothetical protein [Solirubrobacterales bacterium]